MTSATLFLQPTSGASSGPNYINASAAGVSFLNYSLPVNGSLSTAEASTLVQGGGAAVIAEAYSTFSNDPNFIELFGASEASGVGSEDNYSGSSNSDTKVVATFNVNDGQTLSFDFASGINLNAKEIENPNAEYSRGRAKTAFLVLDTSQAKAKVLGYYGINGRLISSEQLGVVKEGARKGARHALSNVALNVQRNVGGDDGVDAIAANVSGTYSQTFKPKVSEVTLVQVTESATKFAGDSLVGNLGGGGGGVTYGTLKKDDLAGSSGNDSLYSSLGNDTLHGWGGDDILEGGLGNDKLYGDAGNDKLHGGDGDDVMHGGPGSDSLAGGAGADYFNFEQLGAGEVDTLLDFQVGVDKLQRLGGGNRQNFSQNLIDTASGAQFTANTGGQVLFNGLSVAALGNVDALFG
jgi:serralysin